MSLLLDTNICIAFLNGSDHGIRQQLFDHAPEDLFLCSVVKAELYYGARNSERVAANLKRLSEFFEPFRVFPFDDTAAEWYGIIRALLRREGRPIGSNDLMIAAIARANDAVLVTRNEDEFCHVAGLQIETW